MEPTRSIPACAGEPDSLVSPAIVGEVYPRVCGGTIYALVSHAIHNGLSPRVRGNQFVDTLADQIYRSIPACAGEPIQPTASST